MALPFFYAASIDPSQKIFELDEQTAKHVVQVLRMKTGELLQLTDGKGNLLTATIISDHKKKCTVEIKQLKQTAKPARKITVAISLIKNTTRFEWFLEKATEIGVETIIPLLCERTEKQHFRFSRMQTILTSAMLQSQQCWLPQLHQPSELKTFLKTNFTGQKFIAHCAEEERKPLTKSIDTTINEAVILIGPEGDFTKTEIDLAIQNNFMPVMLGETRLRTETAGVVAATLLKLQ